MAQALLSRRGLFISLATCMLLCATSVQAQTTPAQNCPTGQDILGTWTAVSYLEISGDSEKLTVEDTMDENPVLVLNPDGTGDLGTSDQQEAVTWSYDETTGILKLSYEGYESQSYLRMINTDNVLMAELQDGKYVYIAVLQRTH